MGLWSKGVNRSITGKMRLESGPMLRPGDKIRVKPFEWYIEHRRRYGMTEYIIPHEICGTYFNSDMCGFCDREVTIKKLNMTYRGYYYEIVEDSGTGMWHDKMFQMSTRTRKDYIDNKMW